MPLLNCSIRMWKPSLILIYVFISLFHYLGFPIMNNSKCHFFFFFFQFKRQTFLSHDCWSWEVQYENVGRFDVWWEPSLEKAMAPHSITLAWKIPWIEEPGRLQSMGSLRVGHDWATSLSLFTFMHWRRKWQPTPYSCLENPRDGGGCWAAVYGVTQSRTRRKGLSSSSSREPSSWFP